MPDNVHIEGRDGERANGVEAWLIAATTAKEIRHQVYLLFLMLPPDAPMKAFFELQHAAIVMQEELKALAETHLRTPGTATPCRTDESAPHDLPSCSADTGDCHPGPTGSRSLDRRGSARTGNGDGGEARRSAEEPIWTARGCLLVALPALGGSLIALFLVLGTQLGELPGIRASKLLWLTLVGALAGSGLFFLLDWSFRTWLRSFWAKGSEAERSGQAEKGERR